MFDTCLPFVHLGSFNSTDNNIEKVFKYRFKTPKYTYIVDVELFKYQIFIIKFYLKEQALSDNRFSYRTHEGVAAEVLGTCLHIASELYKAYPLASFGFVGGNDVGENKENNKRYRIYKNISLHFFSPDKFNHFRDDKNSLYLMFNKFNIDINQQVVMDEIIEHYHLL